jgi:hypothetical protein
MQKAQPRHQGKDGVAFSLIVFTDGEDVDSIYHPLYDMCNLAIISEKKVRVCLLLELGVSKVLIDLVILNLAMSLFLQRVRPRGNHGGQQSSTASCGPPCQRH